MFPKNWAVYEIFGLSPGNTFASLQKVKDMLRRLRWHRDQSGHTHHRSAGDVTSDLCGFIRGDKTGKTGTRENSGKDLNFATMATAMMEQQNRATVCCVLCNKVNVVS